MQLKLIKNSSNYIFDLTPSIVISSSANYKDNSNSILSKMTTWNITGYLVPGSKTLKEQQDLLVNFLSVDYLDSAQLIDSSNNTIENLTGNLGVIITNINFPEGSGPQHATRRNYTFELSGILTSSTFSTTGIYTYTIEYAVQQNTKITRTISGTISDLVNKQATAKYETLKTTLSWNSWANANLVSDTYSANDSDTVCTFTIVHLQYWLAFPTGVTNAEVTRESSTDIHGVLYKKISGWFEGSETNCDNAIAAENTGGYQMSYSKSRAPYSNRTNFSIELLSSSNSSVYYSIETLSIKSSLAGLVFKSVLGGGAPIKQTVGKKQAQAVQSGVIKKLTAYPDAPAKHWSSGNLVDENVTREPTECHGAGVGYVLTYNYVYEFETTPSF